MSESKYEFEITDPLILEAFKKWDESDDNSVGVPENLPGYESTFDAGFRAGWESANINAAYRSERQGREAGNTHGDFDNLIAARQAFHRQLRLVLDECESDGPDPAVIREAEYQWLHWSKVVAEIDVAGVRNSIGAADRKAIVREAFNRVKAETLKYPCGVADDVVYKDDLFYEMDEYLETIGEGE